MPTSEAPPISSDLRKLLKKRSAIKASVESINNYVNKFDPTLHSCRQLQTRLAKLIQLLCSFDEIQLAIIELDQNHEEDCQWLQFVDDNITLKAILEDLIAKHSLLDTVNSSHSSHTSVGDVIRLPTIQPPVFDGSLGDWTSFIDTFNALFHNNASLNNVQRLHYLKTSVSGPAADIIKNFSITAENYQVAYDELVRQYENKGLTIQTHIRALLQSPKVGTPSAVELRNLHHHVASHVRALKALGQPVQSWDAWLVTLICGQLDPTTAGEWQLRQTSKELPTYESIELFLSKRVTAYEVGLSTGNISEKSGDKSSRVKNFNINSKSLFTQSSGAKHNMKCPICSSSHKIYSCDKFNKMSVPERKSAALSSRLCLNCLNFGHQVKTCRLSPCFKCNKMHNSKLHEDYVTTGVKMDVPINEHSPVQSSTVLYTEMGGGLNESAPMNVMLATLIIHVIDKFGQPQVCRAVLDSGSQLNFITQDCAKILGLTSIDNNVQNITGVCSMTSSVNSLFQSVITSRFNGPKINILLHSLQEIVSQLPSQKIDFSGFSIPSHIKNWLADPTFSVPGVIDILLGSEVFFHILGNEEWLLSECAALRNTKFGWIVTGKLPFAVQSSYTSEPKVNSNSALSLFISKATLRRTEESKAEAHFQTTFTQNLDGRYIVRLPLCEDPKVLGDSRFMAEKRFLNVEKRLIKDSSLALQYKSFMDEYLRLGHMELAETAPVGPSYYLPHHAVFKHESLTTKIRIVFDGSAKSSSGFSLNDILMKGPKVQPDIFQILWRFRIHPVAITADVEKMYRQIVVAPQDRDLQRICYRSDPFKPLQEFKLTTVTYSTKAASFLSTRCLVQIAQECHDPVIKRVIAEDFYVDDLISGGSSDDACYKIYESLLSTLCDAGLRLRKWCCSSLNVMNRIPAAHDDPNFMVHLSEDNVISALGLMWQPYTDSFRFTMKVWAPPTLMSKRSLLSDVNSVYDPIGLLCPVLIKGKIFLQQLWSLKIGWDDELSEDLQLRWIKFYSSLKSLDTLMIPRRVVCDNYIKLEVHGFCDASKEAFGACIYIRSISTTGEMFVHLYTSKSRVAPIRPTTIPRLELCGALLLAELINEVLAELKLLRIILDRSSVYLWSDSTIVLGWINSRCPFQVYVSNRLARIQDITSPTQWHHVPTSCNPADIISRGINTESLPSCSLWWQGPKWLKEPNDQWPASTNSLSIELPETRPVTLVLINIPQQNFIFERYSKWITLIRITAWLTRFVQNLKCKNDTSTRKTGPLTVAELADASTIWFCYAQAHFSEELIALKKNQQVSNKSKLRSLNPFIDEKGLIRVGGRLANLLGAEHRKFPIVLPSNHRLTRLLFIHEHERLLHAGPQAMIASIQTRFWPLRSRDIARSVVRKCSTCFKFKPIFTSPMMAPLPKERVTSARPFTLSGVDFCGPVLVKSGIRRVTAIKSYVSVFVCFATRAVHLELVSNLTSDAFLAALNRFMARRGICSHIYSDNATNFVGAHKILKQYFQRTSKNQSVIDTVANMGVQWHFNPPSAPHMGGLWEAAVKSAKHHMLKATKGVLLSSEELNTLLCQIEAVLNSRPIIQLSSDPNDHNALTPSHFLIGGPALMPQEPDLSNTPANCLHRYQLMRAQFQKFWKRWSLEYLPQYHKRGRWITPSRNFEIGDLAILKEDNQPPLHWKLVRIIAVHPGKDMVVRVVTVRLSSGTELKRPVIKLALLPTDVEDTSPLHY